MKIFGMMVLAASIGLGALISQARADGAECATRILQTLEAKGIKDVKSTEVVPVRGSRHDRILGYKVWIRLDRCEKGYVIGDTTATCFIEQIYSFDGCQVDGL